MQIRLNKSVLKDLDAMFKIIYKDKPIAAEGYIYKIREYIKLLEYNPKMGNECKYKNISGDCRIINDNLIRVSKIINTKQNYKGKK